MPRWPARFPLVVAVAAALDAGDAAGLAAAIDAVAASGLVPFAAHMRIVLVRIVLAERTGDAAPLALARSVLGRLGSRLFLRKLDEVARQLV